MRYYYKRPKHSYTDTNSVRQINSLASAETNDCVVRAISNGFEIDYETAHVWVKKNWDRKDKDGVRNTSGKIDKFIGDGLQIKNKTFHKIYDWFINGDIRFDKMWGRDFTENRLTKMENKGIALDKTAIKLHSGGKVVVKRLLRNLKKGTFFVLVRRHAFIIKDNVICGNIDDAIKLSTEVLHVYEIK